VKVLAHQAKLNSCYGTPGNDAAEKGTKTPIIELLAEIGPLEDEEAEKKAG
jgi:hypothetical protein